MVRCVGSVLIFLVLWCVPTLAQSAGSREVNTVLSAGSGATASGVSLTSTVQPVLPGAAMAVPHPSGTITLFDGTTALGGAPLALAAGPASRAFPFAKVFGQADASLTSGGAQPGGVFGDFNGDGALDLVLVNISSSAQTMQVQGFVSAPGGKFVVLPVQSFSLPQGSIVFAPAFLDVDGDGHLDLLDGNTVAYGKGDGTFSTPIVMPTLASGFIQSYAVDVDVDGKVDIVVVNAPPNPLTSTGPVQLSFTVFRNGGSGQFTSLGTLALAAPLPADTYFTFNIFALSFADLNGDGKPDVVTQSNGVPLGQGASGNHLNALLNRGDGTFASPLPIDTAIRLSLGGDAVAFGDLNGDGKIDLVLGYSYQNNDGNYIGAALGNGDGTFGGFQTLLLDPLHSGPATPYVQLGDFNLDGKIDAVAGTGELALGKGDGTFSLSTPLFPEQTLPNSLTPVTYPLLEASLAPGVPPSFVYLDLANGNNAVFTPVDSSSVITNVALSAGTHSLTAHYSGDSTYAAAVSPAVTVDVAPAVTSLAVTSSANPSYAGTSVTFTATLSGLAPGGRGNGDLLQRVDHAGDWASRQRERHVLDYIRCCWQCDHHRHIQRRCERCWIFGHREPGDRGTGRRLRRQRSNQPDCKGRAIGFHVVKRGGKCGLHRADHLLLHRASCLRCLQLQSGVAFPLRVRSRDHDVDNDHECNDNCRARHEDAGAAVHDCRVHAAAPRSGRLAAGR
jgi:hypothetical protein